MHRIAIILSLMIAGLSAADTVTVDPSGVLIVAGSAPTAPASTEVRIGGGQVSTGGPVVVTNGSASALQVTGGASVGNLSIGRTTQAGAQEAVRGDDPRLVAPPRGMKAFMTSGTFTVPSGVTMVVVRAWGGGGSGQRKPSGTGNPTPPGGTGAYVHAQAPVVPGSVVQVNVGVGGTGMYGSDGTQSSFGSNVVAGGGLLGGAGGGATATDPGALLMPGTPGLVGTVATGAPFSNGFNTFPGGGGAGSGNPASPGKNGMVIVEW